MVARVLPSTNTPVDISLHQAFRHAGANEKVIQSETRIAPIGVSEVIPERINAVCRMKLPDCIDPALGDEFAEGMAHVGVEQRVFGSALRLVDIEVGRNHIVVACQNHWHFELQQLGSIV